MTHVPLGTVWQPWTYVKEWTCADRIEDWRYGNTLKFEFDTWALRRRLTANCGGDGELAHRLAGVLHKRVMRHCLAMNYADDITLTYRRVEIVPFCHSDVWDKPIDWEDKKIRYRSMMSVRWLMRHLMEERRDFDPTLKGQM